MHRTFDGWCRLLMAELSAPRFRRAVLARRSICRVDCATSRSSPTSPQRTLPWRTRCGVAAGPKTRSRAICAPGVRAAARRGATGKRSSSPCCSATSRRRSPPAASCACVRRAQPGTRAAPRRRAWRMHSACSSPSVEPPDALLRPARSALRASLRRGADARGVRRASRHHRRRCVAADCSPCARPRCPPQPDLAQLVERARTRVSRRQPSATKTCCSTRLPPARPIPPARRAATRPPRLLGIDAGRAACTRLTRLCFGRVRLAW